jgi:hypothetical protein
MERDYLEAKRQNRRHKMAVAALIPGGDRKIGQVTYKRGYCQKFYNEKGGYRKCLLDRKVYCLPV